MRMAVRVEIEEVSLVLLERVERPDEQVGARAGVIGQRLARGRASATCSRSGSRSSSPALRLPVERTASATGPRTITAGNRRRIVERPDRELHRQANRRRGRRLATRGAASPSRADRPRRRTDSPLTAITIGPASQPGTRSFSPKVAGRTRRLIDQLRRFGLGEPRELADR